MSVTQLQLFDLPASNLQSRESKFQSVLDCLDSIHNINSGGCGISALAIYRWCKENGLPVSDRPFRFVYHDDCFLNKSVDKNESSLRDGNLDDIFIPCHIVIELDGYLFDSGGRDDFSGYHHQTYQASEPELLHLINQTSEWNSSFNRERNIPKIEYALGIDLSDVETW